jgi:hypothetical protein
MRTDNYGMTDKAYYLLGELAPLHDAILHDAVLEWDLMDAVTGRTAATGI